MRHSVRGIEKWRCRAIFTDLRKTRISILDDGTELRKRGKIPESFLGKPLPKMQHPKKVALRRLSITELLSGASSILCFIIFVYIKMFQLEIQGQESMPQLDTYAALSLLIGITFLVTFTSSMILRRVFPGEIQISNNGLHTLRPEISLPNVVSGSVQPSRMFANSQTINSESCIHSTRRRELERKSGSLVPWFLSLLSLNVMDILFTNPSREANPLTLLSWAQIGILPSACMKIGLVLLFGILCTITRKVTNQIEWNLAARLMRGMLIVLVAFYTFVVAWNMILRIQSCSHLVYPVTLCMSPLEPSSHMERNKQFERELQIIYSNWQEISFCGARAKTL